ncbi:MAG: serine hydrolase domain-containing protein [Longimicrobiales bacterium]
MTRIGYAVLQSAVLATAGTPVLHAQVSSRAAATIDSIIRYEMQQRRVPGLAIAVVENGKVIYKRAYGTANLETGTPLTTDAVFELASVTKQFTAAAIMLLVEEGKVGLDDPITRYIDGTPATWSAITVRQLLTHTSGMHAQGVPRIEGSAPLNITTKAAFTFIAAQPMRFAPGQEGWYSDPGYFLLGMIIEKASGQTYRQFMQQRIFAPLGMANSSILDKLKVLKGRVPTYMLRDGELLNWRRDWDYELPSFFGIWSTLDDLVKWDAALRGNVLLKPASLQQMWTPAKLLSGLDARVFDRPYGFGFELADLRGQRTAGHGGASGTYLLRFLDEPLTIILLSNLEGSGGRHHVLLARSVAGALRPAYRPPNMMAVQSDPDAQLTRTVQAFLGDLAARRDPTGLSSTYQAWYNSALGFKAFWSGQIAGFTSLTYLGADDVKGRPLWDPEPLDRHVHYRLNAGERVLFVTVGVNSEGRIGKVDFLAYR